MTDSFLFSVNTVLPIFIVIGLGMLLRRIGLFGESFQSACDKLVFRVALPALLFSEIALSESVEFDLRTVLFCVCGVLGLFVILCLAVPLFIQDNSRRGAFIQGVFRSNYAILGLPLAQSMFGDSGVAAVTVVLPFAVILFNVCAVVTFTVFSPGERRSGGWHTLCDILLNIVKNPLVIAIAIALPVSLLKIQLPLFAERSLTYVSNLAIPIALLGLGAGFSFAELRGSLRTALIAALLKTVAVPAAAVTAAILLGFRGVSLGAVFLLFGGPSAVSGYIMSKSMGGDYRLTGMITILTTLLCTVTLFIGTFLLRYFSFI